MPGKELEQACDTISKVVSSSSNLYNIRLLARGFF